MQILHMLINPKTVCMMCNNIILAMQVVDEGSHQSVKKKKVPVAVSMEERDSLMAVLMNWLSQLLSQCTCSTQNRDSHRQCRHLLPFLTKLLPDLSPSHHLPLLKLTLWTIKLLPEVCVYYNRTSLKDTLGES